MFIAALVKDKFERHLIMMEQNGLNRITYWTITYIFNYIIYIIIAIVIAICSIAWRVRLFTQVRGSKNLIDYPIIILTFLKFKIYIFRRVRFLFLLYFFCGVTLKLFWVSFLLISSIGQELPPLLATYWSLLELWFQWY